MSLARSIIVLVAICACAMISVAQNSIGSKNTPEEQVKQVEHDWLAADAKGDAASLGRIIADDFIVTSFNGGLLFKADIIPQGILRVQLIHHFLQCFTLLRCGLHKIHGRFDNLPKGAYRVGPSSRFCLIRSE